MTIEEKQIIREIVIVAVLFLGSVIMIYFV